jgi:tetratricopeptide (TPR) repeat protein
MMRHPLFQAIAFALAAFAISTALVPDVVSGSGDRSRSGNVFALALGEGRKVLAYEFFVKADAYFHSGYYPSFFDQAGGFKSPHMAADAGAIADENDEHGEEFESDSRDFIERIGRHFRPASHTHLDEGGATAAAEGEGHAIELGDSGEVREILPWLRLSATLDPSREETYTTTAYWLRSRMNRADAAEKFLREGLRHNPQSYSILFELGRIADENRNDQVKAKRLWELALLRWKEGEAEKEQPDRFGLSQIVGKLGVLAEREDRFAEAIHYFSVLATVSPNPAPIQQRIGDLKAKSASALTDRKFPDTVRKPR